MIREVGAQGLGRAAGLYDKLYENPRTTIFCLIGGMISQEWMSRTRADAPYEEGIYGWVKNTKTEKLSKQQTHLSIS